MVKTWNSYYSQVEAQRNRRPTNPSKPPKDGACLFMDMLPGELRNRIYEYALSWPDGVTYHVDDGNHQLCVPVRARQAKNGNGKSGKHESVDKLCEANNLQYVSKQIRSEIKGLILKHNDIKFITTEVHEHSPVAICLDFLQQLRPEYLKHLRTIVVHRNGDPEDINDASDNELNEKSFGFSSQDQLIAICRANPKLMVKWTCPKWSLDISFCEYVIVAATLLLAYKDSNDIVNIFPIGNDLAYSTAKYDLLASYWRNAVGSATYQNVSNFRIYPNNVCKTREEYVELVANTIENCGHHFSRDTIKTWKDIALTWYDYGI
ncbi:hypothetical protein K505DRAFT_363610 [Melanomma pulvis-pyrius CBS 109.77]|uniref:Uncharacterized protein n=1 Tax=Melanomma pulvis-pyrius CBS 109.77 TaxID=1314802 RepID=A0A6A6X677_9PLEO|nr:hypothetical protein K505DRAFT_363610 [Melanomma pulvis-pyrius CBS 109.77]